MGQARGAAQPDQRRGRRPEERDHLLQPQGRGVGTATARWSSTSSTPARCMATWTSARAWRCWRAFRDGKLKLSRRLRRRGARSRHSRRQPRLQLRRADPRRGLCPPHRPHRPRRPLGQGLHHRHHAATRNIVDAIEKLIGQKIEWHDGDLSTVVASEGEDEAPRRGRGAPKRGGRKDAGELRRGGGRQRAGKPAAPEPEAQAAEAAVAEVAAPAPAPPGRASSPQCRAPGPQGSDQVRELRPRRPQRRSRATTAPRQQCRAPAPPRPSGRQ